MQKGRLAVVLGIALLACMSTPEPRPARLDPSNPAAPPASPLPPFEAFSTGPQGIDEPLLPPEADEPVEHHHDHGPASPEDEHRHDHGPASPEKGHGR